MFYFQVDIAVFVPGKERNPARLMAYVRSNYWYEFIILARHVGSSETAYSPLSFCCTTVAVETRIAGLTARLGQTGQFERMRR